MISWLQVSLGAAAGLAFALCVLNVTGPQSVEIGIVAGLLLGVLLSTLWHVDRLRRRVRDEMLRQVAEKHDRVRLL